MSKGRLVAFIAEQENISKSEAEKAVEMVFNNLGPAAHAETDWRLTIPGFGAFEIKHRKATPRRNPQTGETFVAPEKNVWDYDPAPAMQEYVETLPVAENPNRPTVESGEIEGGSSEV
ncbi:MAG: HU family DNA-binding protein [Saprospiraceae bacterium]|nr:HU family DNA-binding protein [Saprospiraceae bacterium]